MNNKDSLLKELDNCVFNLTDEKSGMNMLHLAEAPGSFVQSIISYT